MLRSIWKASLIASTLAALATPGAHADILTPPPHEKTFTADFGKFTVGIRDESINRIAPLNGTSREALVSNVVYGRVPAPAGGVLQTGYAVGCAVRLDIGQLGTDPTLEYGVLGPQQNYATDQSHSHTGDQSQSRTTEQSQSNTQAQSQPGGPLAQSQTQQSGQAQTQQSGQAQTQQSGQLQEWRGAIPHVTVDPGPNLMLQVKPGDVKDVLVGNPKNLIPGKTVRIVTRDLHIAVDGCIGPVTIREFTYVYAKTPEVDDSGAVFGDPVSL